MNQTNARNADQHQGDKAQSTWQNAEAIARTSEAASRATRETTEQAARIARDATEQSTRAAREAAEQTTRFARETVEHASRVGRESAEQATRMGREAAEVGERAARASADVFAHNTDVLQRVWQSGFSLATQLSEQSFDQFARMVGLAGDRSKEASHRSSRHVAAILHSSTVLTAGWDTISREWIDFAQRHVADQRDRFDALIEARTPQDFTAIQAEIMRDGLEGFLHSFRRVAEASAKLTEEAVKTLAQEADRSAKAAQ
jgi:hypothetical protein